MAGSIKSSFLSVSKQPPADTAVYLHVLVLPPRTCARFPERLVCFSMFLLPMCVCALLSSRACFSLRSQVPPLPPSFLYLETLGDWSCSPPDVLLNRSTFRLQTKTSGGRNFAEESERSFWDFVCGEIQMVKVKKPTNERYFFFPSIIPHKVHDKYCQNFSFDN